MKVRHIILWLVTVLILVWFNLLTFQKEQLIAEGSPLFLELGPVDPRSLIQGDYMQLRYDVTSDLWSEELPRRGALVIRADERNVGHFVRIYDPAQPLREDELLLQYHMAGSTIYLGTESFFFQEGEAERYADARYGELRVGANGETILIGLRGENLEPL